MPTLTVKNATVADGESLCRTCYHVHMQRGYRESDEVIFCTYASWDMPRLVPFKVRDCTDYIDRDTPSRKQMEEMAILIEPRSRAKAPGFARTTGRKPSPIEE